MAGPPARKVTVGVQLTPQHTSIDDYRRAWLALDEMGVDSIWNWDHFFPLSGHRDGNHFEGWTLQAALGALTKQATIGCLVHCMSYRNPAHFSQMAKTLDHILGGRFILGLGAGWFKRDYDEYGYEFGTAGDRLRNLERGIKIMKDRWRKDPPRPVRGDIPILIGGGGERVTLRITAEHADYWHGFGDVSTWSRKSAVLDDWCRRVGRDPAAITRSCSVSGGDARAAERYAEAGAGLLIYGLGHPYDLGAVRELLSWRDAHNRR